jgi:sortase A
MKNIQNKNGSIFIIIGIMLLLVAFSIILHNIYEDANSGKFAEEVVEKLWDELPEVSYPTTTDTNTPSFEEEIVDKYQDDTETTTNTITTQDIPTVSVEGDYYLGIISIPSLGLELPILDTLTTANLKKSPCLYCGSIDTGDIIIGGHNYQSHFGKLQNLKSGDEVYIIDANGVLYKYEVTESEIINGYDIETMKSNSDTWDLTLFTCTLSGQSRVTVRATRIQ